jgi:hypothetical protein
LETIDLRKQYKHLYQPRAGKAELVDVPPLQYLMIDGAIEAGQTPGTSPGFEQGMIALYGVAYTLKFTFKKRADNPIDYPVMALEALWFVNDGRFVASDPSNWTWRLMSLEPDAVTQLDFQDALAQVRKKKPNPALDRLRLETFREGLCVQMLHVGPYSTEPATVQAMTAFAQAQGYTLCGQHHEVYMGDPRRTAPEKLKTVLRHPVEKSAGS